MRERRSEINILKKAVICILLGIFALLLNRNVAISVTMASESKEISEEVTNEPINIEITDSGYYEYDRHTKTINPDRKESDKYTCVRIDTMAGETFTISGSSYGTAARMFVVTDAKYNALKYSYKNETLDSYQFTIPTDGVYLFVTSYNNTVTLSKETFIESEESQEIEEANDRTGGASLSEAELSMGYIILDADILCVESGSYNTSKHTYTETNKRLRTKRHIRVHEGDVVKCVNSSSKLYYNVCLWSTNIPGSGTLIAESGWKSADEMYTIPEIGYMTFIVGKTNSAKATENIAVNEFDQSFEVTRDRVQIFDDIDARYYENLLSQARYTGNDSNVHCLTIMHTSDTHYKTRCWQHMLAVADLFSDKIEDVIHTGDLHKNHYVADEISAWANSGCGARVLNILGNHDSYTSSSHSLDARPKVDTYADFFAPFIEGWDVVQPTGVDDPNSEYYCACYYYKDYVDRVCRLVCLDTNHWDTAQHDWLVETLEEARTLGYTVIIAGHCAAKPGGQVISFENCNFSNYNIPDLIMPNNDRNTNIDDTLYTAIDDFIDAGGDFACYLCGHHHKGCMGYVEGHPNIIVLSAVKSSYGSKSDNTSVYGGTNQDIFDFVTIIPESNLIKVVRYGAQVDHRMRPQHAICIDYSEKEIVAQW